MDLSRHRSLRAPSLLHGDLTDRDYPYAALLKYTGVGKNAIFIVV
jgi:hypothetical protein